MKPSCATCRKRSVHLAIDSPPRHRAHCHRRFREIFPPRVLINRTDLDPTDRTSLGKAAERRTTDISRAKENYRTCRGERTRSNGSRGERLTTRYINGKPVYTSGNPRSLNIYSRCPRYVSETREHRDSPRVWPVRDFSSSRCFIGRDQRRSGGGDKRVVDGALRPCPPDLVKRTKAPREPLVTARAPNS